MQEDYLYPPEGLSCGICWMEYNPEERKPVVLSCGHTYCQQCIALITTRICPSCRSSFEKLIINYSLLSQVETRIKLQNEEANSKNSQNEIKCPLHQDKVAMFCVSCLECICYKCFYSPDCVHYDTLTHLRYDFKPALDKLMDEARDAIEDIYSLVNRINRLVDADFVSIQKWIAEMHDNVKGELESLIMNNRAENAPSDTTNNRLDIIAQNIMQSKSKLLSEVDIVIREMKQIRILLVEYSVILEHTIYPSNDYTSDERPEAVLQQFGPKFRDFKNKTKELRTYFDAVLSSTKIQALPDGRIKINLTFPVLKYSDLACNLDDCEIDKKDETLCLEEKTSGISAFGFDPRSFRRQDHRRQRIK